MFAASAVGRQKELASSLRRRHVELVLDTDVAELSAIGRFSGAVRQAPWAQTRPLETRDFDNPRIVSEIARFAVEHGFQTVLTPTHFLGHGGDSWLQVDADVCQQLRIALDSEGGGSIAIDCEIIMPYQSLRDDAYRLRLAAALRDLPFENLWLRISGFGADATPTGVRRYIESLGDLVALRKPIVSDGVGGLTALAILAFGAAGAISHGVSDLERFDTGAWHKPAPKGTGGPVQRLLIPGLDRQLTMEQVRSIADVRGGRNLLACRDANCCKRGLDDMLSNPKAHYLYQRRRQIDQMSAVPESRRPTHFIRYELIPNERKARAATRLGITDMPLRETLAKDALRLERLLDIMENLQETRSPHRSRVPKIRLPDSNSPREMQG